MPSFSPQSSETRIDRNAVEISQHNAFMERLETVYDADTVQGIAETHGLGAIHTSLTETLRNAGALYLRYGSSSSKFAHNLAPKFRTMTRLAEISKTLRAELDNLDFWDCWQIFQHLHSTGHPLTERLDNSITTNPLLSGNVIIEEIRLLLNSISRFEENFFEILTHNTDKNIDLGLYFFVEVVGAVWQSLTGKSVVTANTSKASSDSGADEISSQAFAFLSDSIMPLATIPDEEIIAAIHASLGSSNK